MYKLSRNILSLLLGGIFVLSLSGLRMFVHYCSGCDVTGVYLFVPDKSCCDSDVHSATCQIAQDAPAACCELPVEGEGCGDCCHDEVIYLLNDYELTYDRSQSRIEPQSNKIFALQVYEYFPSFNVQKFSPTLVEFTDPPPRYAGRNFVIFSHQIKIC